MNLRLFRILKSHQKFVLDTNALRSAAEACDAWAKEPQPKDTRKGFEMHVKFHRIVTPELIVEMFRRIDLMKEVLREDCEPREE